jgi:hypothetical protein
VAKPPARGAKRRTNDESDVVSGIAATHVALALVELAGIEPASSSVEPGLLRV